MPILPPPPPGSDLIYQYFTPTWRAVDYFEDGSVYRDVIETDSPLNVLWASGKRRSTQPYRLVFDQVWKPANTYQRTAAVFQYMSGVCETVWESTGSTRRSKNGTYAFEGLLPDRYCVNQTTSQLQPWPTNMRTRINTELLIKVGSRKTNYGESIGEMRQTVNHLARSTSSVLRAALAARRGRWSEVARHLGVQPKALKNGQSASSKWLEYQYGWLPLIGDVYDTHQLLQKGLREKSLIASNVRTITESDSVDIGSADKLQERRVYGQTRCSYRAKVYYSVTPNWRSQLASLGLINPLEVAWALVPYSFVVDWFIPVGNFLEAISATMGVDFIDGHYSRRITSTIVTRPSFPLRPENERIISNSASCRVEYSAFARERMLGFPMPGLYYKSPFSTSHVTSALALLRQLVK